MKNLLRKLAFVLAVFAILIASASCKQNNDGGGGNKPKPTPAPGPNPSPTGKITITFRASPKGMATLKASVEGMKPVSTDTEGKIEVEKGKTITFTAHDVDDQHLPETWLGVTSISEDKLTATLKVEKNATVVFKLQDKPKPKVRVTYNLINDVDSDGIWRGKIGIRDITAGDKTVNSGDEVEVGHEIQVSAQVNQFNGKNRIKEWVWTSPSLAIPSTQEDVNIEVVEAYVSAGINFTIEFEPGEKLDEPLPEGQFRVKAGVFLWDNLEDLNFFEGGSLYDSIKRPGASDFETETQGGINLALPQGSTVKYRLEPGAGKVLYKWDGIGVEGKQIDTNDNKIVTLNVDKNMYLKAIMKNEGMSIFSVFVKDEKDQLVKEDVAKFVAKRMEGTNELVDCRISKKYVEAPTDKDVILTLMPTNPSYQIDDVTATPAETVVEKDTENLNRFTVKNVKDGIVIMIKMKKVETVDITIDGDANVEADSKKKFTVPKSTSWKVVKENEHITGVKFTEDYELKGWNQNTASGTELADMYKFENSQTIFVSSKIKMGRLDYSVKTGAEKAVDQANVSIRATKDNGEEVQSGTSVPYGTKVNFVATIGNPSWEIKRWSWNVKEDPTTQNTNHTKASIILRGRDVEVILTAEEVIKLTIQGDDKVKPGSKGKELSIDKGSKWQNIRWREEIRNVEFEKGYKLDKWLKGSDVSSPELKDDDVFDAPATIFVKSKDENLMKFTYNVRDKDYKEMKSSDYTIEVKNADTNDAITNGADLVKGTKVSIKVSFTNTKLKVRYWQPTSIVPDANDPNKALVTIGEGDMAVEIQADEAITITIDGDAHLKQESKKSFPAWKGVIWYLIRDSLNVEYAFFRDLIKFEDGYELDQYLKDNAQGTPLGDYDKLDKDTTIYITSKKKD